MKRLLVFGLLILCCAGAAQPLRGQSRYPSQVYLGPACPLTVNDIIKMSQAGVHGDSIIAEFQRCDQHFKLSKNDLARLKNAGVSQPVIQAMIAPPANTGAKPAASGTAATPQAAKPTASGASARPATNAIANAPSPINASPPALPSEPGLYLLADQQQTKVLGQPVTFERTGSKFASGLNIKAEHNIVQIPGAHAQTMTGSKPVFAFVPSRQETPNGMSADDLLLISLEVNGDRRQIDIAAGGAGRAGWGTSIPHQLQAVRTEPSYGLYELTPADPLKPGEYAVYLERGDALPAVLYAFSVQSVQ